MCRSRRELSNAYLLAKFGFDTAENEPPKVARGPRQPKRQIEWLAGVQNPQVEEKERRAAEEKVRDLRAREGMAAQKNVRWHEEPVPMFV